MSRWVLMCLVGDDDREAAPIWMTAKQRSCIENAVFCRCRCVSLALVGCLWLAIVYKHRISCLHTRAMHGGSRWRADLGADGLPRYLLIYWHLARSARIVYTEGVEVEQY